MIRQTQLREDTQLQIIQRIQQHLDAVSANFKLDPDRTMREAQAALKLAETVEPSTWLAQSWNALGVAYGAQGRYPEALAWFQKAVDFFEAADEVERLISTLDNLGHIQLFAEQYADSLVNAMRALEVAETAALDQLQPESRNRLLWRIKLHISGTYMILGDYDTALQFLTSCLAHVRERDSVDVAQIYSQFAILCGNLDDSDAAIDYGSKALETIEPLDRPYEEGVILGNLAQIHQSISLAKGSQESLSVAIHYIRRSLDNFQRAGVRDHELRSIFILASMHIDAKDYQLALEHFEQAIVLAAKLKKREMQSRACIGKAQALRLLGKLQGAESFLSRGEDILRELSPKPLESSLDLYLEQYHLYKKKGELDAALAAHEKHASLFQEKLSADQRRVAAEIKARFDVERAQQERAIAQKDKEIFERQSLQLKREVELKTKRVTLTGLLLGQRNEILTKVKREALATGKGRGDANERLQKIATLISEHLDSANTWETFIAEFELLHHDFITKLSRRYPLLTGLELKVCALIKSNLSSKEIARLLCISSRSIETYRYRVRKKLGLKRQVDLTMQLASI